jgi:hypothetical protein
MKKILLHLICLIVISCKNDIEKNYNSSNDTLNEINTVIPTVYKYEIKNIKSGQTIILSAEEYLKSDFINNHEYSIKEIPMIKK